jgi:hypothetical protein
MAIKFDRTPYTVRYVSEGKQKTYRRRPPPKLHDMLPKDEVKLLKSKNSDFQNSDDYTVKSINPRQPNVLQIENDKGQATFVDYYDLQLQEMTAPRDGVDPRDMPQNVEYLLWP